jgi:CRP-like cAMP-binding protein
VEGQIKIVTHTQKGKDCVLAIHTAGDVFGEQCFLREDRRETATAMTPTILQEVTCESFVNCLVRNGLLADFLKYLIDRLVDQQAVITNLVTEDSEQRLAATLLRLARKIGKKSMGTLEIRERISQEDLGRIVGTTRSRIGHFLKKFSQMGLVERHPDSFLVIKEECLRDYIQGDN